MNTISLLKLNCMFLTKWFKHSKLNLKDRKTQINRSHTYLIYVCMYVTIYVDNARGGPKLGCRRKKMFIDNSNMYLHTCIYV